MMSKFEIQSGKPIPPPSRSTGGGRPAKYPFDSMVPGDSFFVPGMTTASLSAHQRRQERFPEEKYRARTLIENGVKGVRVWRIE